MTNPTPVKKSDTPSQNLPSPLRCFLGGIVASGLAAAMYFLTSSIAQNFADRPIQSPNFAVVNITVAVRTLVVGLSALGTGVFGIAALGLLALGVQILLQKSNPPSAQ